MILALEWVGSALGLLGAYLLATHGRFARYGWIAFMGANLAMGAFALAIGAHGLLLQQLGFAGTSALGLRRAWSRPQGAHQGARGGA